jgi:acylaminoacyl-peptidase
VLVSESTPAQPFRLFACHLAGARAGAPPSWSWSRLALPDAEAHPPAVARALAQIRTDVLQVAPTAGESTAPFEAVVLRRRDLPGPRPVVLSPHGGPHTAHCAAYVMPLAFLVASGYTVVLVNYRGSTGFGEAALQVSNMRGLPCCVERGAGLAALWFAARSGFQEGVLSTEQEDLFAALTGFEVIARRVCRPAAQSLPGHIGTNDVADCMAALAAAAAAGAADVGRAAAVGGSHGGFLAAHLAGQHAGAFRAAVLRNPVCDLELMVHLSDIPDVSESLAVAWIEPCLTLT